MRERSLYIAETGNHTIRRIDVNGNVTTVAGEAGVAGSSDGRGGAAHLNTPAGIDVNARGELFIADTGNHVMRMLTTDGDLVTIAGKAGVAGFADGEADDARFAGPVGVRVAPDGSVLVADTSNHAIRRIVPIQQRRRAIRH